MMLYASMPQPSVLLPRYSALSSRCDVKLPFFYQSPKNASSTSAWPSLKFRTMTFQRKPPILRTDSHASGRRGETFRMEDEEGFYPEPFWLGFSKETFVFLRSLIIFLAEQPSQLQYIEWPSFQSTLKTATLTLVLMAVLIVALSTVDSALCYLLTLLLRRSS